MYGSTQQPHSTAPLFQKPARSQPWYERDQKNNFRWTSHSSTSTSSPFCLSRRPRHGQTDIQKQIRRRLGSDGRDILRPRSK
ncbi:unnamed protein product [Sphagnum balticum]